MRPILAPRAAPQAASSQKVASLFLHEYQLLTCFMLVQSTPISYHTEANGCIFFTAGVCKESIHEHEKCFTVF